MQVLKQSLAEVQDRRNTYINTTRAYAGWLRPIVNRHQLICGECHFSGYIGGRTSVLI